MTRPTNMSQPLPALTTGFLGREAPNPITDPVDPIDRAAGLDVFVPPSEAAVALVRAATNDGSGIATLALGGTASLGNLLTASFATRGSGGDPTTPTGWTAHPDGTVDASGGSLCLMYYKIADGTETGIQFSPFGGNGAWVGGIAEWSGGLALDTSAETSGTTAPPDLSGALVTPTAGSAALIVGAMIIAAGDAAETGTPDAGWTELHDGKVATTLNPHLYVAYRIEASASGSYTPSATVTELNPAPYGAQTLVFTASSNPVNAGPNATDGDDDTYV